MNISQKTIERLSVIFPISALGLITIVLGRIVYKDIQSRWITTMVHTRMPKDCGTSFHHDGQKLWMMSSLDRTDSVYVIYKEWRTNGKWSECIRRGPELPPSPTRQTSEKQESERS